MKIIGAVLLQVIFICAIFLASLTISPRHASAEWGDLVLDTNMESMRKAEQNPVIFSHRVHRIRFKCKVCHDRIFKMEKGASGINMKDIIDGKWCGRCHNGTLAFSPKDCHRCHLKNKKKSADYKQYQKQYAGEKSGPDRDGRDFAASVMSEGEKSDKKALRNLEKDKFGVVNWGKAVESGKIAPTATLGNEAFPDDIKKSIRILKVKNDYVDDVLFSHDIHTFWLNCDNCHDHLWTRDGHYEGMRMVDIAKGKGCGKCHGKVSFSLGDCVRCHFVPKVKAVSE